MQSLWIVGKHVEAERVDVHAVDKFVYETESEFYGMTRITRRLGIYSCLLQEGSMPSTNHRFLVCICSENVIMYSVVNSSCGTYIPLFSSFMHALISCH